MNQRTDKTGIHAIAVAVLAAAVIILLQHAALAAGKIVVKDFAEVADSTVLIGDVADVTADSEEEREIIEQMRFCTAPSINRDSEYNERQVAGKLYQAGIELDKYEIEYPPKLTIHRKATIITGEELMEQAVEYLEANVPWASGSIEVEVDRYPRDIILEFKETELEFEMEHDRRRYGIQNFHVNVYQDGDRKKSVSLSSYVKVRGRVAVAARDIQYQDFITGDDIEFSLEDLKNIGPGTYMGDDELIGKQAARLIRKGTVFVRAMLDDKPDIESGEMINIVMTSPGLEIVVQGKAMEKGFIGDSIKVLNTSSRKVLTGIVTAPGTVEIADTY